MSEDEQRKGTGAKELALRGGGRGDGVVTPPPATAGTGSAAEMPAAGDMDLVDCYRNDAGEINAAHAAATDHAQRAVELILYVGNRLSTIKDHIGHGNFGVWIDKYLAFNRRQVQCYMAAGRRFRALPNAQRAALLECASLRQLQTRLDEQAPRTRSGSGGRSGRDYDDSRRQRLKAALWELGRVRWNLAARLDEILSEIKMCRSGSKGPLSARKGLESLQEDCARALRDLDAMYTSAGRTEAGKTEDAGT